MQIKTNQPSNSVNTHPHPPANRVAQEEYLTYDYQTLTLFEDFSSGVARKTKYFVQLKDKDKTTYSIERGTQEHSTTYCIPNLPAFQGQRFTSAFVAAKALDEHLR